MKCNKNYSIILIVLALCNFAVLSAQNTSVYVSAHPDDWQLFMNPNANKNIKEPNDKVVFLHITSGDGGNVLGNNNYYLAREEGSLRALRFLSNINTSGNRLGTNMSGTIVNINGHQILKYAYKNIVAYFLRLPDGNYYGEGWPLSNNVSLKKLYEGSISSISAIDGSTTYVSLNDLQTTIQSIIELEASPSGTITFNLADTDIAINPDDHSDHLNSSLISNDVAGSIGGVIRIYT